MGVIRTFLGPRSKYLKELPFVYEARVEVSEGTDIVATFISDTVCGIIEHLQSDGFDASQVEILEVYQHGESVIDPGLYTDGDGKWLVRPQLCKSFEAQYPGHVRDGDCTFSDREGRATGD